METALGLFGILVFIASVIALACGVTYLVVKLTPQKKPKPAEPAAE